MDYYMTEQNQNTIYIVPIISKGSVLQTVYNIIVLMISILRLWPHLVMSFFSSNKKMILSDVKTYGNLIASLTFCKHYRNLFYYRIGYFRYFIQWLAPGEISIIIHQKMPIGKHAHFVHNINSHLNAKCIGENFICYQHVVLGSKNIHDKGKPQIGNNVTICTGAVVVGDIIIGNNVIIGANAFVNRDVPDNSIVIGNPGIIKNKK